MHLIDIVGYLASTLVLLTFCMGTMFKLRAVAICSNLAFVVYGFSAQVYPVFLLHLILLPINVVLLSRMTSLVREANRAASTDLSPSWLQPFMHRMRFNTGDVIFRKGDDADALYLVESGSVELPEINHRLSSGELFGEIGLFSVERRRTQSAVAAADTDLLWMSGKDLEKLCERNPGLSLYFLRLTVARMTANAARAEQQLARTATSGR
jgi:CRP/FNR family transcriptional regulator, cyclic AMP receptor protein